MLKTLYIKGHDQESGKENHRMGENIFESNFIQFTLHDTQIILTIQHQWQQQQRQIITSVSNDMEKVVGRLCTVGGKVKWCSCHGKQHLKRWNRTTVWSSISMSKCTLKAVNWEQRLKQYTNVHGSIIHSCQKVTITQCQSVDDGQKKCGVYMRWNMVQS